VLSLKKIAVFHTGGTIAMEEDRETGAVKPKQQNPLLQFTPELSDVELIVEDVFQLPSPHMTQKEMSILQQLIDAKAKEVQLDGVVVTHGTDTLEETAYFLDLTVQANIPIVITGAMRSSNELGADGLPNFISAVRVAASDQSKDAGVLVVLNDEIHAAKNVTKTHTSNIATFQSPQFGPMGIVTKSGVLLHQTLIHREKYKIKDISKNVVLLKAYSGMDASIFEALRHIPLHGLVIEALGQGNLPPRTIPAIKELLSRGIPIVLVSRCFNGVAEDVYGYEGGGKHLRDLGVIFSNGLNGQKARIKLLVALEATNDLAEIRRMFVH
jgi:L-asparaginase